jgi:SAM-dependent methyltransferase
MPDQFIYTCEDVLTMLDALLESSGPAWDDLFESRPERCPFLTDRPDENLVAWYADDQLSPGYVLELGCGQGRNATYLADLGCTVDAIDSSAQAIEWAAERADRAGVRVNFQLGSIFGAAFEEGSYDLVYDSGCFHHLAPHRRRDYVELVTRAVKPGGSFGLVCFRPEGGSGYTDQQVYERASLGGGLGYSAEQLRGLWDRPPFSVRALRPMRKEAATGQRFGEDFLWTLLATKEDSG